jgi:Type II secretion system (T2SS), protein M subtype b
MNWRERWARFNQREQRLIIAAGVVLGLLLLRALIVTPFLAYRENLAEEIVTHRDWLENASAYLARAGDVERTRDRLREQLKQIRGQLIPGNTPDLAAANLQDTLHRLADETSVEIRSTQKMRDEPVGDLRRIAVRITVGGEIQALAQFLAGVEYNPERLLISFFEVSQRGVALRNQGARTLSATIEVSAFIQGPQASSVKPAKGTKKRPGKGVPGGGVPGEAAANAGGAA